MKELLSVLLFIGWILLIFGVVFVVYTNNLILMTLYTLAVMIIGGIIYSNDLAWWED